MFQISEKDASEIRALYGRDGIIAAAMELQCRYPEIETHTLAIEYVRSLMSWKPLASQCQAVHRG